MFFHWLNGYEVKRKRLLKKAPPGALKEFLSTPFPQPSTPIVDVPMLSVDFETTGLNARKDKLLSVGFVNVDKNQIRLASCYHQIINTTGDLQASNVVIHQITDDIKNQGLPLKTVIDDLLIALSGKVMVVHFARIEKQFLQQACLELYGLVPAFPIIDTLAIAKRRLDKSDTPYDPSQLRLSALRENYALPRHHPHNALSDAIATAELLMALISTSTSGHHQPIKNLLL